MPTIYSARWVLPMTTPPVEYGAVAVDGGKIVAVGARADVGARFAGAPGEDFGEAAIIPGLVNAHSHLELTVMRGFLEGEERDFFSWLKKLTVARMAMTDEDLLVSATCGAIEAARAGITCIGDSSSFAVPAMEALKSVGLRGVVYQESFGPDPKAAEENLAALRQQLARMREHETELVRAGVSPHAPYTVSATQLALISELAIAERLPLMMHAAESEAEQLLMLAGAGPFADGLEKRGIAWQAPGVSTIQYLKQTDILRTKPLLAHCINVDEADLETIRTAGASIAHCPKSNAKLGHGRAPFAHFLSSGVKLGLGSDSVASNNSCDMLEEARFATLMGRTMGAVNAADALTAATLGGARALGLDDRIGSLSEGMDADLTVVNLNQPHQQPVTEPIEALIFSSSGRDVLLTVVAGKEIYRGGRMITGEQQLLDELIKVRKRLASMP